MASVSSVMREFAGDTPAAHHIGAVADMDDLDLLGADHENGGAVVHQAVEQPEYLGLGADIDAARRLVENEELRIGIEPFADDDFLLIAARQSCRPAGAASAWRCAACR